MTSFDPRLTPARKDLAAAHLRGRIEAEEFVEGRPMEVRLGVVDLRHAPNFESTIDSQALYGEQATLYEDHEGWGWVQLARDGYVGYLSMNALGEPGRRPTHWVTALQSFIYPCADIKKPRLKALPLGALVSVGAEKNGFAQISEAGFVFAEHLAPIEHSADDFVEVAEQFLHAPYLWGGKSSLGIDCSGLVQVSLQAAGFKCPRDADLQEEALGAALALDEDLRGLARGDLVFWRGHVGIMRDDAELLHANARQMRVASEPLREARDRILAKTGANITSIKRVKRLKIG